MHSIKNSVLLLQLLLSLLLLTGCAGSVKNMRQVPAEQAIYAPKSDQALIVFMRPSSLGFANQSSVFEVIEEQLELVGIVAAKKRVAHYVKPGKHLFMVVSESADFMSAEVAAGKTYYVYVTPRMGMWKARFSLLPVTQSLQQASDFKNCDADCEWVEKNEDAENWAKQNLVNIQAKRQEYFVKWMKKPETDRPMLKLEDGR